MQRIGIFVGMALACGCAEPFEAPSAYEGQPYLCDDQVAYQAVVERCRQSFESDGSCRGVASMRGVLQSQPVTITSEIYVSEFFDEEVDAVATRDRVDGIGRSPYFQFTLRIESIGGAVDQGAGARQFEFSRDATAQENPLDDALVKATLRMSNGADSTNPYFESGDLTISTQTATEQAGSFSSVAVDANPGDTLDGCFHYFYAEEE